MRLRCLAALAVVVVPTFASTGVQKGRRVGRERVVGHCGYLGCRWRAL